MHLALPGFLIVFLLCFVVILLLPLSEISAQTERITNNPTSPPPETGNVRGPVIPFEPTPNRNIINPDTRPNPTPPTPDGTTPTPIGNERQPPPPPDPQTPIIIGEGFLNSLYGFVVMFGGKVVGWAGMLLNWAIQNFVIGFATIYLDWGIGLAVENGWRIIRDVFNISFIFAIVYIGLRLIFDADDSSAKRSLGYLLAAALLINFSLFISKFVVDFSNSLAAIIYTTGLSSASANIGAAFINLLGLSSAVDNGSGTLTAGTTIAGGLTIVFGTFIFMLMACYALAAGAFLIFVRGITLLFFMIFSPIMFLGWIFPQFQSFTSKYWSMFLANAFMAPAFMFCLYLTFEVMSGFKYQIRATGGGSIGNLFSPQMNYTEGINALIVFVFAIGMMLASISVAKRMGAFGGGLVVSVGDSLRKSGRSWLGRNTVGRAAGGVGWLNDKVDNKLNQSRFGRFVNQNVLAQRSRQNVINAGKNAKFGGAYSRADDVEFSKKQVENGFTARKDAEVDKIVKDGIKALKIDPALRTRDQNKAVAKLNSTVPTLSVKKIEKLSDEQRNAISHLFTKKQIEEFEKSDKVGDASKTALSSARTATIKAKIETDGIADPIKIAKISKEEIEALGSNWILNNAHKLTPSQFDEIQKSASFNPEEKAGFNQVRIDGLTSLSPSDLKNYLEAIRNKQKEIAKLPVNILRDMTTAEFINSKVIKEIDSNTDISRSDKIYIAENIMTLPAGVNQDGRDYLATPKMTGPESEWIY
jgi:hypothetical protein